MNAGLRAPARPQLQPQPQQQPHPQPQPLPQSTDSDAAPPRDVLLHVVVALDGAIRRLAARLLRACGASGDSTRPYY